MRRFLSRKNILILVFLLLLLFAYFLYKRSRIPTPSPTPSPQSSLWKGISPGLTSLEEAKRLLGAPRSETENLLEYASTSPTRKHTLSIENGVVGLVKEIVSFKDSIKLSDLKSKYGEAPATLYGSDAESGYYLFVYPEKGVAYLGNPATETLLEIWYFPLTNLEDFIKKWASSYSKTLSPRF